MSIPYLDEDGKSDVAEVWQWDCDLQQLIGPGEIAISKYGIVHSR